MILGAANRPARWCETLWPRAARFYRVNLLQGRVSLVGSFSRRNQVTGIAIQLDR